MIFTLNDLTYLLQYKLDNKVTDSIVLYCINITLMCFFFFFPKKNFKLSGRQTIWTFSGCVMEQNKSSNIYFPILGTVHKYSMWKEIPCDVSSYRKNITRRYISHDTAETQKHLTGEDRLKQILKLLFHKRT